MTSPERSRTQGRPPTGRAAPKLPGGAAAGLRGLRERGRVTVNPYPFENRRGHVRSDVEARAQLAVLARRLRVDLTGPPVAHLVDELVELVMSCQLNIEWYTRRLRWIEGQRRVYFGVSLLVLLLLPIAVYGLSLPLETFGLGSAGKALDPGATGPLTALVTGLFAFHRGLSAWLDKREVAGIFAKACSGLKQRLYEFEQRWADHVTDEETAAAFAADVEALIATCRQIVREEQEAYYENLSYPTFDLVATLGAAGSAASSFVKAHRSEARAALDERIQADEKVRLGAALVDRYAEQLEKLRAELEAARAKPDPDAVRALLTSVADAESRLRAAQLDQAVALAERDGRGHASPV